MILPEIYGIEDLYSSLEMDDAIYNFGMCDMGATIVLWLTKEIKSNGTSRNFVYPIIPRKTCL